MTTLYKLTKIRYRIPYQGTDYVVDRKKTVYTVSKNAVILASKHAAREAESARKYEERTGCRRAYAYEVQVEIGEVPETKPAVYCPRHGVQPLLTVPGLAAEPTCLECI